MTEEHSQSEPPESLPIGESEPEELSLAELSEAYATVLKQNERQIGDAVANVSEDGGLTDAEADAAEDSVLSAFGDGETDNEQPADGGSATPESSIQQLDAADNAPCPVSPKSIVESLLFVGAPAGVKLTLKKIAAVMRDVSPREVKKTIAELNREYEQRDAAFRIVEQDGHFKLHLCEDLSEVQNYFFGRNKAAKLSQGAIDVLAVVAYNQPVTKSKVEMIRTRPSGSVLSQLLRRDLIAVVDREQRGKEQLYRTTDRFLKLFGLESLDDLPQTSVVSDLEELTDY